MIESTNNRRGPDVGPAAGVGLVDSARRIGRYVWFEERLFEVMGRWVQLVPQHEVKLHLATHGPRHAWHAALWRERFPSVQGLDVDDGRCSPDDAWVSFVAALGEPADEALTLEKLVGLYRVAIPHLVATYTRHQRSASLVGDGPVLRTLGFVLADDLEAWREGELLLESLAGSEADLERAATHQVRLQRLLLLAAGS